jgi:hypothetical protein
MNRVALQKRFPGYSVYEDPSPACGVCKGAGVVRTASKASPERPCVCACVCACVTGDPQFRADAAKDFQRTINELKKDFGL